MTVQSQEVQNTAAESSKNSDKENNFAQLRQLLERERSARMQAEQEKQELQKQIQSRNSPSSEDDEEDEPYVSDKKLNKKLSSFEKRIEDIIDQKSEKKARALVEQERQQSWMKANPDFYDVMQHAQIFAEKDPELAETILSMPEGFERQKLVYRNIKALGLHKKEEPKANIQDKIEQNRRSPYYQPSGIGSAPYQSAGDFSPAGQKNAYEKMKQLKEKLRI